MAFLVSTVEVQLLVLAAALGTALLASLAYVLRHALGLAEPPPPEEETHH